MRIQEELDLLIDRFFTCHTKELAVFFNPKTDRDVVDGIVQSLENL